MLRQGYETLSKLKKRGNLFCIHRLNTANLSNIHNSELLSYGGVISINFSDEKREEILKCLKLMKELTRLYYPLYRKFKIACETNPNMYNEIYLLLKQYHPDTLLDNYNLFDTSYKKFKMSIKCLFNHYKNVLKLPNGKYFYYGINHIESLLNLSPLIDNSIIKIIPSYYFSVVIFIPLHLEFFENSITDFKSYPNEESIISLSQLFRRIYTYCPRFTLYQKNIEKFITPLPYKTSKTNSVIYNLINYITTSNFIQQTI